MAEAAKSKTWQGAFSAFDASFKQIKANPNPALLFVGVYTVVSIISLIIQGKSSYSEKDYVAYADILVLFFVLPLTVYALALADKKKLSVSEFMQLDIKKLILIIATSLFTTLVIILSFLALIVPIIWVAAWFALVVFPVAEKGMTPIQAMKESKRLTQAHKGKVWGVIGVMFLVSIALGIIGTLPYIGVAAVAFSSVWTTAAMANLYRWLQTQ